MEINNFKQQTTVIAKNQPEYNPLPAEVRNNKNGEVVSCWKPTLKERINILFGANIFTVLLTFGGKIQPQRVTVGYPERSYAFWDKKDDIAIEKIVIESKLSKEQKELLKKQGIDFHESI